jgi:hypothetical protein
VAAAGREADVVGEKRRAEAVPDTRPGRTGDVDDCDGIGLRAERNPQHTTVRRDGHVPRRPADCDPADDSAFDYVERHDLVALRVGDEGIAAVWVRGRVPRLAEIGQ